MSLAHNIQEIKTELQNTMALEYRLYSLENKVAKLSVWRWIAILAICLLTALTLAVSLVIVMAAFTQPEINQVEQINQPIFNSTIQ